MLFQSSGGGRRFCRYVHHTDGEREYAYDRTAATGRLDKGLDEAAAKALTPRKDDPYLVGFYVGNEVPWPGREAELVEMILAGKDTAMQRAAKAFLAAGIGPNYFVAGGAQ